MLYLDAPIGPIRGLMVYRDHEDSDQFYYVPERPRLALNDGVPEFLFLKFRRDITDNVNFDPADTAQSLGGGYMAFTVDLSVDERVLSAVKGELAQFAEDDVKLAPIQFRKGSVRLSLVKDEADADDAPAAQPRGLRLFEEVFGATQPSLFGNNRATFALLLDREAATLMENGLRSGISPVGVIYNLEFLGLRPAFRVKVRAEYKRVYDHLEAELGARGQIGVVSLAADIAGAFQKLRDSGAVQVEVINFTDDEDLQKKADEAWQWFERKMLEDFFQPALEPPSFMTRQSGQLGMLGQLQGLFGALAQPQAGGTLAPQMGAPTPAQPTTAPGPQGLSDGVPATSQVNRTAAAATAGSGGAAGPAGAPNLSPFQVAFSLKMFRQDELHVRTFDYSLQQAEARTAAPQGMFSTVIDGFNLANRIRTVDLDDPFFDRLLTRVSVGGDLAAAGIDSVAVNLEYPGTRPAAEPAEHVDGFLFKAGQPSDPRIFTTFLNDRRDRDYRYSLVVTFAANSTFVADNNQVRTPWTIASEPQLVVSPLDHVELMDVTVTLGNVDAAELSQVEVSLVYDDPVNGFHTEKTLLLKPGDATQHWQLRLAEGATRRFSYRLRYFLTAGNLRIETEPIETEAPVVVVNSPYANEIKVRLVPLLDESNLLEAIVDLDYVEPARGYRRSYQEIFDETSVARRSLVIPTLAAEPAGFSYQTTVIRLDGSVFESDRIESDTDVAVIRESEGTIERIRVRLPQASLGTLIAVKVDFEGLDAGGDFASVLFTPSQLQEKVVALAAGDTGGGPFRYAFTVTGYDNQGRPIPGASGQSADTVFIVQLPG